MSLTQTNNTLTDADEIMWQRLPNVYATDLSQLLNASQLCQTENNSKISQQKYDDFSNNVVIKQPKYTSLNVTINNLTITSMLAQFH